MNDAECVACGAGHAYPPMDGCAECGEYVFETDDGERVDTSPLSESATREETTDEDGVTVADGLALEEYVALGELINANHERPDACRCWGYDGMDCLSEPTAPCGPCERVGFTEPAPAPDADGDREDEEPEVVADGGTSTRRAVLDAIADRGRTRAALFDELTDGGHDRARIEDAIAMLDAEGEVYRSGDGYHLTDTVTDGGRLVGPRSERDWTDALEASDGDDNDDERSARVDGQLVDVVWLGGVAYGPATPGDHPDVGDGEETVPIPVRGSGQTQFEQGWLKFQEFDGTQRAVPAHRVHEVRLSVSEAYLGRVR